MNDRFLRACRREPVDCTPVWMMRQAGRYMAEYRALRAKHTMLEVCKTPELALEVTLQPLKFGMDAAILFADILLPLEPMGAPFDFAKGEGPVIFSPVANKADVDKLHDFEIEEGLGYVLEAIKLLKKELKVPLIGFAGAPFTLASYLVEGGKSTAFAKAKRFMYAEPETFGALMHKLAEVVRRFLHKQIDAGVDAVQLFDSWVGQLSAADYRTYVMPHVMHILKDIGCRFALDDFGSGLSSFAYLKKLPVDFLKIDGIFVEDIANDPVSLAMVRSINEVGHVMGMETIAEFVENDEILARLQTIGVNYAQGYGIGRPRPLSELTLLR